MPIKVIGCGIYKNYKKGYSRHQEVMRWRGRFAALYAVHESMAAEMERRGYVHESPLDKKLASGGRFQRILLDSASAQKRNLRRKGCRV
jgi:hypothetical protein